MKFDKRAKLFIILAAIFCTCLITGDIIGGKLIEVPLVGVTFTTTVGMIPFPVTFLLTDLLNEFYGKSSARFVTWVAFGMAALAFSFIFIAGALPIAGMAREPGWGGVTEQSFANVFLGSQRMILASMAAYLTAQFVDIGVFHLIKRWTANRFLWLRATGSTAVSQMVDTVVINFVAWSGLMSTGKIIEIVFSAYGLKLFIAIALTPLIYVAHAVVERWLGLVPVVLDAEGEPRPLAPSVD